LSFSEKEFLIARLGKDFVFEGYVENYARDKNFTIKHIKFEGELDYSTKSLSGEAVLSLRLIDSASMLIELDAVNFAISSVRINGVSSQYSYDGKKLSVQVPEGVNEFDVAVTYAVVNPKQGLFILGPDENHPTKPYQAWTQGESQDNRYWLPLYDYPNLKCTSELVLIVPETQTVVSNGVLVETVQLAGKKKYHWLMDQPHSTYLIAFCAGEFDSKVDNCDGTPLIYFVPKGRGGDIDRSFSKTPDMMRFFTDFTGVRYPFKKYSQTCVTDFVVGGMENTSATTHTERTLHDEVAHEQMDFSSDGLVSHELAHQWFGDLVTCRDWSHIWLNESFATFFQALYFRHNLGVNEFYYDLVSKLDSYLEESAKRYIRPISTKFYANPEEVFDRHSYEKGSLVLNSLMNLVGEQSFKAAIHSYLERFKFGNVETDDLRKAFEDVTGKNLEWFFDQWVYSAGHPQLKVNYHYEASDRLIKLTFKQNQESRPFRLSLNICVSSQNNSFSKRVLVDSREQTLYLLSDVKPAYVCVDPDLSAPGSLQIEEDESSVIAKAKTDSHLYCRILAIREMAKTSSPKMLDVLEELLVSNDFWGISAEAALALKKIGTGQALAHLLKGRAHPHAKARRFVAQALGAFKDKEAFEALKRFLKEDKSYYVRAAAANSLGETRNPDAFDLLLQAIKTPSHNEVIAVNAALGLGELKLDKSIPVIIEHTHPKVYDLIRRASTLALGSYSHDSAVRDRLNELLRDEDFVVRINAIEAIKKSGDPRFVPSVESVIASEQNGRVIRFALEAKRKLSNGFADQIKQLREQCEQLSQENRRLRDEIEALKTKIR
jgi:aminopeptidase N